MRGCFHELISRTNCQHCHRNWSQLIGRYLYASLLVYGLSRARGGVEGKLSLLGKTQEIAESLPAVIDRPFYIYKSLVLLFDTFVTTAVRLLWFGEWDECSKCWVGACTIPALDSMAVGSKFHNNEQWLPFLNHCFVRYGMFHGHQGGLAQAQRDTNCTYNIDTLKCTRIALYLANIRSLHNFIQRLGKFDMMWAGF